jgi:heme A synthase
MKLARYATITLAFTVITILLGAFVRATGSGAGCGSHWPSCGGEVIPRSPSAETAIEFTHRATSGILLLMVAVLLVWVLRATERGSPARFTAIGAVVFIVFEALVGAALVLFEWVGDDDSPERAAVVAIHLVNTFVLLAAVTLTAWFAAGNPAPRRPFDRATRRWVLWCALGLLVVGSTGAITALGDTLFPPETLVEGLRDDFAGVLLQRLRWIHPVIAILIAIGVMRFATRHQGEAIGAGLLIALVVGQLALGVVNVLLLAPVWMQLIHLFVADLLWIVFVITATSALVARGSPSHLVKA